MDNFAQQQHICKLSTVMIFSPQ